MKKMLALSAITASLTITTTMISPAVISSPAHAQSSSSHICMQRITTGRPGGDSMFTIITAVSKQATFEAKGFSVTGCNGKLANKATYKAQMCSLAASAPQAIQQNFTHVHGASPQMLCDAVG